MLDHLGRRSGKRRDAFGCFDAICHHTIDDLAYPTAKGGGVQSGASGNLVPMARSDIGWLAPFTSDLLGEIQINVIQVEYRGDVIKRSHGGLIANENGVVLGVRVSIGDEDVDDHLVMECESVGCFFSSRRRHTRFSGVTGVQTSSA